MIEKRTILPEWASERLVFWLANKILRENATSVAENKKRYNDPRPLNDIVKAFRKGWAMENVAAEWMRDLGFTVEHAPPNEKWYDLIVNGVKVDIKGNWNAYKSVTQTAWERDELNRNRDNIVYLCFQIAPAADHLIEFLGAAPNRMMRESSRGDGTGYVFITELKDFKP